MTWYEGGVGGKNANLAATDDVTAPISLLLHVRSVWNFHQENRNLHFPLESSAATSAKGEEATTDLIRFTNSAAASQEPPQHPAPCRKPLVIHTPRIETLPAAV
jgi:hypothetical protein